MAGLLTTLCKALTDSLLKILGNLLTQPRNASKVSSGTGKTSSSFL
ncbi:hypothetical protein NUACC26_093250 [Scytonema sp. NUACC26]